MHLMAKLFEYFDTSIACKQAPREGRAVEPVHILLMPTQLLRFVTFEHLLFFGNFRFSTNGGLVH